MTENQYRVKNHDVMYGGLKQTSYITISMQSGEDDNEEEDREITTGDIGMSCTEATCDLFW